MHPLLGVLGCYSVSMADAVEEEDDSLFRKGSTTEEGADPTTIVASRQEQYPEGEMMSVMRRIRSKHLLKSIVQKQSISQLPFAQSQAP